MVGGTVYLLDYASQPGRFLASPGDWPKQSLLTLSEDSPTLLIFLHPRCSCSKASLGELNAILANVRGKLKIYAVFIKPENMSHDWEKDSLWKTAKALPNVNLLTDEGGVEARHFQAQTSGLVLVYDVDQTLLYSGGITVARGHSGENDGRSTVISLLNGKRTARDTASVFGCALFDQGDTHVRSAK